MVERLAIANPEQLFMYQGGQVFALVKGQYLCWCERRASSGISVFPVPSGGSPAFAHYIGRATSLLEGDRPRRTPETPQGWRRKLLRASGFEGVEISTSANANSYRSRS